MQDNVSIVVIIIVLVIIIVIFPLYNYFERQDNMSYNLALKATAAFVEDTLDKGYMDQNSFNKYVSQLSSTGNLYDIQLEAHKKIYTKDPSNPTSGNYVEQYKIDYNNDIFVTGSSANNSITDLNKKILKNDIYTLNTGDELYVKLKNSSTTMAGAIFNTIVPTSSKDRIAVNYGGVVRNNTWNQSPIFNLLQGDVYIELRLVGNQNNAINLVSDKPTFYMDKSEDRTIKYRVILTNLDANAVDTVSNLLKQNMVLKGLISDVYPANIIKESNNSWLASFNVNQDLIGYIYGRDAYVLVPSNLFQGTYGKNVETNTQDTPISIVRTSQTDMNPSIDGPYNTVNQKVTQVFEGKTIYFYLNYGGAIVYENAVTIRDALMSLNNFSVSDPINDISVVHEETNNRFKITLSHLLAAGSNNNSYIRVNEGYAKVFDGFTYSEAPAIESQKFNVIDLASIKPYLTARPDIINGSKMVMLNTKIHFDAEIRETGISVAKFEWEVKNSSSTYTYTTTATNNIAGLDFTPTVQDTYSYTVYAVDAEGSRTGSTYGFFICSTNTGSFPIQSSNAGTFVTLSTAKIEHTKITQFKFDVTVSSGHYSGNADIWRVEGCYLDSNGVEIWESVYTSTYNWYDKSNNTIRTGSGQIPFNNYVSAGVYSTGTILNTKKYIKLRFSYQVASGHAGCITTGSSIKYDVVYEYSE
ncbi:MAG: hypothetical protein N2749_06975 [Clostridia bacterium]|nr:hypothetical protein [Clostridia bacterium]